MTLITRKNLKESEVRHYKFQMGCYFSGSKKVKGATFLWSDRIKDTYWNYATKINMDEKSIPDLIQKVITFYKTKGLQPAMYVTPFTEPRKLKGLIKDYGFKLEYQDAWMFYGSDKPEVVIPEGFEIKQVENKGDMEIFVDTFNQSYSAPEDPYGILPKEYGECLFDSFVKQRDRVAHCLAYLDKKPAGVATLIYSGKFSCIYNLGIIPDYRKRGIGAILTLNAVADSYKKGSDIVFLQTEKGSYNEEFFKKLGFYTKFIGKGFVFEK